MFPVNLPNGIENPCSFASRLEPPMQADGRRGTTMEDVAQAEDRRAGTDDAPQSGSEPGRTPAPVA